jgi:hypothetical protein
MVVPVAHPRGSAVAAILSHQKRRVNQPAIERKIKVMKEPETAARTRRALHVVLDSKFVNEEPMTNKIGIAIMRPTDHLPKTVCVVSCSIGGIPGDYIYCFRY